MLSLFLLCAAAPQSPFFPAEVVVDPYTARSHDGRWTVSVEPSDSDGLDDALVAIRTPGRDAVEVELPFAPQTVVVTAAGLVVGYGYDVVPATSAEEREYDLRRLVLFALEPDGSLRWERRERMLGSRGMDTGPEPVVTDLAVQPMLGRVVFLAASTHFTEGGGGSREQALWFHDLDTGDRTATRDLSASARRGPRPAWRLVSLDAVPERGLLLLRWTRAERQSGSVVPFVFGPAYSLENGAGDEVWREEWPNDHGDPDSRARNDDLRRLLWHVSPVLAVDEGGFDLWRVRSSERIRFEVTEAPGSDVDAGELRVLPQEPVEYEAPRPMREWGPDVVELQLERSDRSSVEVEARAPAPLETLFEWAPLEGGGWTGLRWAADGGAIEVVESRDGEVKVSPVALDTDGRWDIVWVHRGDGRWWGLDGDREKGGLAVAARAGVADEAFPSALDAIVKRLGDHDWNAADVTPEGRLALLVSTSYWPAIATFDADGEPGWSTLGDVASMRELPLIRDVAWTADGRLAGVDHDGVVYLFGDEGEIVVESQLEELTGTAANYVTRIEGTPTGGLLVEDFDGDPALVQILPPARDDPDGGFALEGALSPRLADGAISADRARRAHVDAEGALWTHDDRGFMRLDGEGLVAERLGEEPDDDGFGATSISVVLPDRLVAQDEETGAVFAWTHDGEPLTQARGTPADVEHATSVGRVEAAPDGTVWIERRDERASRWSPDGRRLDEVDLGDRREDQFSPEARGVWWWGYDAGAALVGHDGERAEPQATIERSLDGRWIQRISDLEALEEGPIYVLHHARDWRVLDAEARLRTELVRYARPSPDPAHESTESTPQLLEMAAEWAVPAPLHAQEFEVRGDWVLFSDFSRAVLLLRLSTKQWFEFDATDTENGHTWSHGLGPDGSTLVSFDEQSFELHRYRLPD